MRKYNPFPPSPVFVSDEVVNNSSAPDRPQREPKQPRQPRQSKPKPLKLPEPSKTVHKPASKPSNKTRIYPSHKIKASPWAGLLTFWVLAVWVPVVIGLAAFQTREKPRTQQTLETLRNIADALDNEK